jgi:hypothetical protein
VPEAHPAGLSSVIACTACVDSSARADARPYESADARPYASADARPYGCPVACAYGACDYGADGVLIGSCIHTYTWPSSKLFAHICTGCMYCAGCAVARPYESADACPYGCPVACAHGGCGCVADAVLICSCI